MEIGSGVDVGNTKFLDVGYRLTKNRCCWLAHSGRYKGKDEVWFRERNNLDLDVSDIFTDQVFGNLGMEQKISFHTG